MVLLCGNHVLQIGCGLRLHAIMQQIKARAELPRVKALE
jgi:hypothetical protein